MNDDISILLAFHASCGPEAAGHAESEPNSNVAALIERFIAGECTEAERRELSQFLMQNPEQIRRLAEQIKGERDGSRRTA